MDKKSIPNDISIFLKVFNDSSVDSKGRTALFYRSLGIQQYILQKNNEEKLLFKLKFWLNTFNGPDITKLLEYIKSVKLQETVLPQYRDYFIYNLIDFNQYQREAFIRDFLELDLVARSFFDQEFSYLQQSDMWLYVDLVSYFSIDEALDLMEKLIISDYSSSELVIIGLRLIEQDKIKMKKFINNIFIEQDDKEILLQALNT